MCLVYSSRDSSFYTNEEKANLEHVPKCPEYSKARTYRAAFGNLAGKRGGLMAENHMLLEQGLSWELVVAVWMWAGVRGKAVGAASAADIARLWLRSYNP